MFKPVTPNINFPEMEKKWLDHWYKSGIVEKYLNKNKSSKKRFSFLDGPITANNPMGVHHGWGRTYKDIWQRFFNMRGFNQRFQNGFDCQGLWIEVEVEKELGIRNKKDIENLVPGKPKESIAKFVELCKERVRKFSQIQTEQSKRLGYFMDWDNSYFTMSDENNYMIWYFLKKCHENGWIYKGKESVPWCPRCETAISQHEMLTEDYKELVHKSIYMRLPIAGKDKEYLLVWTTTPWTIPANIAVAASENLKYVLVQDERGDNYWIVKEAVERLFPEKKKIMKEINGKELVGIKYKGAFDDIPAVLKVSSHPKFHSVIPTDPLIMPITTTEGTGLVHTAVSAGAEDFKLGKKLSLPMIAVIADNADYIEDLGFLTGLNAKKHPEIILDFMEVKGFAWKIENYKHRYPACWRCKTELVWKVAKEWYIAMDKSPLQNQKSPPKADQPLAEKVKNQKKEETTLRERMIEVAKKIRWIPEFGLEREIDWLSNMSDWLISKKNRYWGLALPIFECNKCGWFEVIGGKEELREKAAEGWDKFGNHSPHKPFIDEVKIKCKNCGNLVSRISDVGNVWLDAGVVPYSTYIDPTTKNLSYTTDKKYWKDWFPADFITESFPGQFKNWFYSMIALSTVLERENPYKTVLGYASVLGEDGRPMHKSWGNAIEFNEAADKIGVDVMRWIYVTQNPTANLLFGFKKADETRRKFHLLLWNVYNFFVTYANVDKYQISKIKNQKHISNIKNILDIWIISKLDLLIKLVTESLSKYDALIASMAIEAFVTDLSQWYVRRSRDRIGPTALDEEDKYQCYQTLNHVLTTLSLLIAPFNPFISEEIYTNLTGEESVHLADWPISISNLKSQNSKLLEQMEIVRKICELGHAKRKAGGIKVRQPLNKLLVVGCPPAGEAGELLVNNQELIQLIKDELNVKNVDMEKGQEELSVELDLKLTPELKEEGEAREIIRQIQIKRKEAGCRIIDKVKIRIPYWPESFTQYLKKETLAVKIEKGPKLEIEKV